MIYCATFFINFYTYINFFFFTNFKTNTFNIVLVQHFLESFCISGQQVLDDDTIKWLLTYVPISNLDGFELKDNFKLQLTS